MRATLDTLAAVKFSLYPNMQGQITKTLGSVNIIDGLSKIYTKGKVLWISTSGYIPFNLGEGSLKKIEGKIDKQTSVEKPDFKQA